MRLFLVTLGVTLFVPSVFSIPNPGHFLFGGITVQLQHKGGQCESHGALPPPRSMVNPRE